MASDATRETCGCGRPRTQHNLEFVMGRGALAELPRLVTATLERYGKGAKRGAEWAVPVALFDATTHALFGRAVMEALGAGGLAGEALVLGKEGRPLEPDEEAIQAATDAVRTASGRGACILLGIGSGAVNDLGKHVANQQGVPYISVATAPSMDGFAAPISAIVVQKVKTTVPSRSPDAVLADLEILTSAPAALVSAGFGDVLGKLTSLADWKLAHVLFDEYWCRETAEAVGGIARRVTATAADVAARSPGAVGDLMEALVRAGTSVLHIGYSRPTSGAEHLVSHFIEMWSVNRGLRPPAHGHVVGVGTLVVCRVAEVLRERGRPSATPRYRLPEPPPARPEGSLPSAPAPHDVLAALRIDSVPANFGTSKFDADAAAGRVRRMADRWPEARDVLAALPPAAEVEAVLRTAGCPVRFSELGIDGETARQAILWSRYLRERYTMLDLAAELGVLPELVDELVAAYA